MTIQERFGALEAEAKGRIRKALSTGNARLMGLDERLAKIAKEDWTVPGLRRHIDELSRKAQEIPGEAVTRIATGTRAPIQSLAKGLADLAKRLEPPAKKPVKVAEAAAEPKAKAS